MSESMTYGLCRWRFLGEMLSLQVLVYRQRNTGIQLQDTSQGQTPNGPNRNTE